MGPTILGQILGHSIFDPAFTGMFAALGAIILLFVIGLDTDILSIYSRRNIAIALGGVILPLIGGYLLAEAMLPAEPFAGKLFIGATLVATSVAVTAAILLDLGAVKTDVGRTIIGAAVVDDVLGLLVLSVSIGVSRGRFDAVGLAIVMAMAVLFLVFAMFIGLRYFTRLVNWAEREGRRFGLKHTGFTLGLGLTFLYAFIANYAGLNAIVGAFIAGAAFSKSEVTDDFRLGAEYIGALFTPIFFVSLGIQVNLLGLDTSLVVFGLILVIVAIVAKVAGCYIPARLAGSSSDESLTIGLGMAPRGEVGLIIASTALSLAIIGESLYSIVVLAVIFTTIIPPPVFRRYLRKCISQQIL